MTLVWWLRPAQVPAVISARREAARWRRRGEELPALELEIGGGELDGLVVDDVWCQPCRRLVPVSECMHSGLSVFHAPHDRPGVVLTAVARRRRDKA